MEAMVAVVSGKKRSYTPGAQVNPLTQSTKKRKASREKRQSKQTQALCCNTGALQDLLSTVVVSTLARTRQAHAVILLSMVNKDFRQRINCDFEVWYRLYIQWKGPSRCNIIGQTKTARGLLTRYPTISRSLPNFRDLFQSHA